MYLKVKKDALVDFRPLFFYHATCPAFSAIIIERKIPAEILYENDCALSILDINPIHYGHALVIPKRHHRDFLEVEADELSGIMQAVHTVSCAIVKAFKLQGFNFFANNGAIAGQSVFHFHIHITPATRVITSVLCSG